VHQAFFLDDDAARRQVQRGVGTSSVGSASYGGSVNFATVNPAESLGVDVQAGGGSWGTGRATAALHSGRFWSGMALFGRVSMQTTDGFREHSGAEQGTFYYGATWQGTNALLKVFGLSGRTRTQLAYLATDEPTLRETMRRHLSGRGYDTSVFRDAEACLTAFRKQPADIVITDLRMPGMSGIDLLSQIKECSRDTEVILVTAYADKDAAVQAATL
jgi:CheY-like chemotaxis protein